MVRRLLVLSFVALFAWNPGADAATTRPRSLTPQEQKKLIDFIKHDWRSRTAESAEQIVQNASRVAHFIPRRWQAYVSGDGRKGVSLSWIKHRTDNSDKEYFINWEYESDGKIAVGPPYATPVELGSTAFAISLIQDEVNNDVWNANTSYLRDPANLNFLQTPQGKLGDLLKAGGCAIQNPTYILYMPDFDGRKQDEFFRLQATVDCDRQAPSYFTLHGLVTFDFPNGATEWKPISFFAARIWRYAPGDWFSSDEPIEKDVFSLVAATIGSQTNAALNVDDLTEVIELRNSGRMSGPEADKARIRENANLVIKIFTGTSGRVPPSEMVEFLRHAGMVAITMSDDEVITAAAFLSVRRAQGR